MVGNLRRRPGRGGLPRPPDGDHVAHAREHAHGADRTLGARPGLQSQRRPGVSLHDLPLGGGCAPRVFQSRVHLRHLRALHRRMQRHRLGSLRHSLLQRALRPVDARRRTHGEPRLRYLLGHRALPQVRALAVGGGVRCEAADQLPLRHDVLGRRGTLARREAVRALRIRVLVHARVRCYPGGVRAQVLPVGDGLHVHHGHSA
mmetsp:Transcript_62458/g.148754  ORF Transcript_62458/g.148754 Transcript_62458/m.148754 type:complete len:203 (+) Transcript_62458:449-1057(+)